METHHKRKEEQWDRNKVDLNETKLNGMEKKMGKDILCN
jgi:hypothetical protein